MIPGATFWFATKDGEPFRFSPQKLFVMKHKRVDEKVMRIPSILGRDFLNQFTVVYSRKWDKVLITDERPAIRSLAL